MSIISLPTDGYFQVVLDYFCFVSRTMQWRCIDYIAGDFNFDQVVHFGGYAQRIP